MHLVILAYIFLFWVGCHPSRTFPPKELEWKPQNRLHILPTTRPHSLLPLTHDPPPLYWLGIGRWCLSLVCVLHFHMSPLLFGHSCVCHCLQVCLTLLQVLPCLLSFLVCGLASALAMPLHCSCYDIFYPCLLYYFWACRLKCSPCQFHMLFLPLVSIASILVGPVHITS